MPTLQFPADTVSVDGFPAAHPDDVTPTTREPTDWEVFAEAVAGKLVTTQALRRIGNELDELIEMGLVKGFALDNVRAARSRIGQALDLHRRDR